MIFTFSAQNKLCKRQRRPHATFCSADPRPWLNELDPRLLRSSGGHAGDTQPEGVSETEIPLEVIDLIGGPTRIRTWNQQIMSLLL
jgi:hypothetical protein